MDEFFATAKLFDDEEVKEKCLEVLKPVIYDTVKKSVFKPKNGSKHPFRSGVLDLDGVSPSAALVEAVKEYKKEIQAVEGITDKTKAALSLVKFFSEEISKIFGDLLPADSEIEYFPLLQFAPKNSTPYEIVKKLHGVKENTCTRCRNSGYQCTFETYISSALMDKYGTDDFTAYNFNDVKTVLEKIS